MAESKEDNEQQLEDLSELRQEVKLTSSKLLDLTDNQSQYLDTLEQYNIKAKGLINQDYIEEALVYLAEAERLLEYGASCGKSIDRNLIICTLHNEACCYYKAADLSTASRYLQGVIFNIKNHIESADPSPSNSSSSETRGRKSDEMVFVALEKKIDLVHYYLKYCTINSQAKNRIVALDAGKRTIQVLKALFGDLRTNKSLQESEESADLQEIVRNLKIFKQEVTISEFDNYLLLTRSLVKRWNEDKLVKKISYGLEKHVSNYSISEVIEMAPMDMSSDSGEGVGSRAIMRQILHFSMGYFTISTQYRLIAEQLYRKPQQRLKSQQYIKANIYHLLAISFLALHVRCDLLFMKQIISSYQHHFKVNILEEVQSIAVQQLADRLLFDKIEPKKKMNGALAEKLHKLRSKSKDLKKVHTQYEDTEMVESKANYKLNETKSKTKRSVSKQKICNKVKKPLKVLNDSLFESTKQLNCSKDLQPMSASKQVKPRTISTAKKVQNRKQRSISKQSHQYKPFKLPPKVADKAIDREKKVVRKINDEYQLGKAKITVSKKRKNSVSSADISQTSHTSPEINRSKGRLSGHQGGGPKQSGTSKGRGHKENKKVKQVFSKHYYV